MGCNGSKQADIEKSHRAGQKKMLPSSVNSSPLLPHSTQTSVPVRKNSSSPIRIGKLSPCHTPPEQLSTSYTEKRMREQEAYHDIVNQCLGNMILIETEKEKEKMLKGQESDPDSDEL